MDHRSGQKRAVEYLYPPVDPFDQRVMDMGDGHRIYVEQCGNPQGIPVLVLHGGPGGGCSPPMRRYFDPAIYRVVLFDQRGCGRSRPLATVENNTTWHLVRDIESIRQALQIEQFVVFGGSWGATLALIYAISHPARVRHIVLRGVFLATQAELDWFYGGGAAAFTPSFGPALLRRSRQTNAAILLPLITAACSAISRWKSKMLPALGPLGKMLWPRCKALALSAMAHLTMPAPLLDLRITTLSTRRFWKKMAGS